MSKIDRYNEIILQELKRNGRIPNKELADRVGLSPSACLRRVAELEKSGVISGYRATINNDMLGKGFLAYVGIVLKEHSIKTQHAFEETIRSISEVTECHNVTGNFEYLLRVETKDLKAFKEFHTEVLGTVPVISNTITHVVLNSAKDERS